MSAVIVILGSGKMAQDIGLWLMGRGHGVFWITSSAARRNHLGRIVDKKYRHLVNLSGTDIPAPVVSTYDELAPWPADIVIEATTESLDIKRRCMAAVDSSLNDRTLLLSTTSSIIPRHIHPRCLGLHFFHPVELTRFVELIINPDVPRQAIDRVISFVKDSGLSYIEEQESDAFAANRLLLPMQAETLRLFDLGYASVDIDSCSASPLLPAGQLTMMDAIGLDVVYAGVRNYLSMMPAGERRDYQGMIDLLGKKIVEGKLGRKSGSGLLCGSSSKVDTQGKQVVDKPALSLDFLYLFINTCFLFIERQLLGSASVETVLSRVFQADESPKAVIMREIPSVITHRLAVLHNETGLSYFKPCTLLTV